MHVPATVLDQHGHYGPYYYVWCHANFGIVNAKCRWFILTLDYYMAPEGHTLQADWVPAALQLHGSCHVA